MPLMDGVFRITRAKNSLRNRMRASQMVLVGLMLVPALIAICLMMIFSSQYHSVILHMDAVLSLRPIISEDLLTETMDVVAGRKRFDEGRQFDMLDDAASRLDSLIDMGAASTPELVVARRLLNTLGGYVVTMGEQMQAGSTVDENLLLNEEVANVAALFLDMLQDSINAEITAAAAASNSMQAVVRTTLVVEICLLVFTLIFAVLAQRSLSRAISVPIGRLEEFAGRIAGGELSERATDPEVEELEDLAQSLNTMAFKLERLIEENTREQVNLKKSEMRALQAQITPHFLYNTLDAIVWLAESRRVGEVVSITHALSDFFRTSLNNGRDWITIEQEARHLEGYLTIQKIRYRDILQYQVEIDEELMEQQVLKLMIQPLVENAIYHGIKNRRGGGMLTVTIRREGDRLHALVRDNGPGMTEEQVEAVRAALSRTEPVDAESGYGLYSVDKRIKLHYNQSEGLRIESVRGEGTTVGFSVPLKG